MRHPLFGLVTSSAAARDPNMITLRLDCVHPVPQLWRICGKTGTKRKHGTFLPPIALLLTGRAMFTACTVAARQDSNDFGEF